MVIRTFVASLLCIAGASLAGCEEQEPEPGPSAESAPQADRVGDPDDWCAEHALPESKCTKCNPELAARFQQEGDWCKEHGYPESACPLCHPMQPPPGQQAAEPPALAPGTRIRFRSTRIERAAGIETVPARRTVVGEGVECTARIEFDRNKTADVRAPIPGVVRQVRVDLGAQVKKGQPLFVLESPRVGELQGTRRASRERVAAARAEHDRARKLAEEGIAPARRVERARQELEGAEAEAQAAASALQMTGASADRDRGRYVLRAPLDGTIVRRPATMGTFATEETSLATVADTSAMWALLDVREAEAGTVREGQSATVTVDGLEGHSFSGEVSWVAPEVDLRTRTVRVRVELANGEGLLRSSQFGRAVVHAASGAAAVAVPRDAVQRVADTSVVFVRTGDGIYEPREVRLGRAEGDIVQVWGPVQEGDAVATEGAFLLKTELSRDSIGAGCCEVEPAAGE